MRYQEKAFALRDLLASIVLVVATVSLLLPTLSEARDRAQEKMCLRNVGDIALAALAYAADDAQGHFPPSPEWANATTTMEIYSYHNFDKDLELYFPGGGRIGYNDPWFGMGLLFGEGYIQDPQVFYCPERQGDMFSWPTGWEDELQHGGFRFSSYLYRIFGQPNPRGTPPITTDDILELYHLESGNPDEALVADIFNLAFGSEPVHTQPFGLNVGFADGHARWMLLGERELTRCRGTTGLSGTKRDRFTYLYFRALSTRDFSPLDAEGFIAEDPNALGAWVAGCCVLDPSAWTRTSDLWTSYSKWTAQDRTRGRLTRPRFIEHLGQIEGLQRLPQDGKGPDGWQGIALKPQ